MCTKSPTLNTVFFCILALIGCAAGMVACSLITYGSIYARYHDKYDMGTGCLKNNPQCYNRDKLSCYNNNLFQCGVWGIIFFLGSILVGGFVFSIVCVSLKIYYECTVKERA